MCIDVRDAREARALVDTVSTRSTDPAAFLGNIIQIYCTFAPQERSLRALSLEHERLKGTGCAHEFAVCTVLGCMHEALRTRLPERRRIVRSVSA